MPPRANWGTTVARNTASTLKAEPATAPAVADFAPTWFWPAPDPIAAASTAATHPSPAESNARLWRYFMVVRLLLALGLMATGGTEWVREGIRKPYIIYNYLYSNGVYASAKPDPKGVMSQAKWSVYGSVAAAPTPAKAGEDVFRIQCAACHTVVGYNGVTPLVAGWDQEFASHQIDRLHILKGFMPQFMGTPAERDALAVYLTGLQAQQKEAKANATAKP